MEHSRDALIIRFAGERKVLSTGALGGGLRGDITAVYNHNDCPQAGKYCEMQGDTLLEHGQYTAGKLGLDKNRTTGMHTGANIDNFAVKSLEYEDFTVTAIVTAGVEVNACRVGETATLHEKDGKAALLSDENDSYTPGTVNIILHLNVNLTDSAMTRAMVTCTEAKVAAMQELIASSRYSSGIATGSGTDDTVIIANSQSEICLTQASEHFKLGEYIGRVVKDAVKDALYRQSGLCTGMQHSVFRRLERFGVTAEAVWQRYNLLGGEAIPRDKFDDMMSKCTSDGWIVTLASLYAHLIDQMLWGMLLPMEAVQAGDELLKMAGRHHGFETIPSTQLSGDKEKLAENMSTSFTDTIVGWL